MSTAREVAVMRRLIRAAEVEPVVSPMTREASIEVAVEIAYAGGKCPIPSSLLDGNREIFDLLSSGWLRFWPPGNPRELRLDPLLLAAFQDLTEVRP